MTTPPGNDPRPQPPLARAQEVAAVLRSALLAHYDTLQRDLPWRRSDDPYRIWVSEIMLQQTRVDTVIPYYERWMERFPSLSSLAAAEREEVLEAWTGLGYYSRARNLHAAAGMVRDRHRGDLPQDLDALRALPGVGEYTAGAVRSIAFGEVEPAVDGNVRRVYSRLFDWDDPRGVGLRTVALALVDPERPGDYNQAVMELGATVCTPRQPECETCPVMGSCLARAQGTQEQRPVPKKRRPVPEARFAVAVARCASGETVLRRRPESGMLGGMWEFPSERLTDQQEPEFERLSRELLFADGRGCEGRPLPVVPQVFSHLRAQYHPWVFEVMPAELQEVAARFEGGRTVPWTALAGMALPVAQARVAALAGDALP